MTTKNLSQKLEEIMKSLHSSVSETSCIVITDNRGLVIATYQTPEFDDRSLTAMTALLTTTTNRILDVFQSGSPWTSSVTTSAMSLYVRDVSVGKKRFQMGIVFRSYPKRRLWHRVRRKPDIETNLEKAGTRIQLVLEEHMSWMHNGE